MLHLLNSHKKKTVKTKKTNKAFRSASSQWLFQFPNSSQPNIVQHWICNLKGLIEPNEKNKKGHIVTIL